MAFAPQRYRRSVIFATGKLDAMFVYDSQKLSTTIKLYTVTVDQRNVLRITMKNTAPSWNFLIENKHVLTMI
jgi:hypothetical protein